jgi:hypothetical protein
MHSAREFNGGIARHPGCPTKNRCDGISPQDLDTASGKCVLLVRRGPWTVEEFGSDNKQRREQSLRALPGTLSGNATSLHGKCV